MASGEARVRVNCRVIDSVRHRNKHRSASDIRSTFRSLAAPDPGWSHPSRTLIGTELAYDPRSELPYADSSRLKNER
jgi:hypothetical protein